MIPCCSMFLCGHRPLSWSVFKFKRQLFHNTRFDLQIKPPQDSSLNIFDRMSKIMQKERAANSSDVANFDYVKSEVGERLSNRIYDIKRELNTIVDVGCGRSYVAQHISSDYVKELVCCDSSEQLVSQSFTEDKNLTLKRVVANEESLSKVLGPESADLVISNLNLHWVNNLPKCFNEVMTILKKDGVFMASIFGGDTLYELRSSLQLAELERLGGISPHISPFARVRDIGSLLTRAGFTMQTIDTEEIVVGYPTMLDVMLDVKGMGEGNASWNRKLHLRRDIIAAASVIYNQLYGKHQDGRFGVTATYQIIYLVGWKPDPSQPTPLARGTGEISLKDLYKLDEIVKKKGKIEIDDK